MIRMHARPKNDRYRTDRQTDEEMDEYCSKSATIRSNERIAR